MSVEATRWAYAQTVGNPIGKAVLVALADRTDHKGECWPSVRSIMQATELSERSIREWLKRLEHRGFLIRESQYDKNGQRASNRFYLRLSGSDPFEKDRDIGAGGAPTHPGTVHEMQGDGAGDAPTLKEIEPPKEPSQPPPRTPHPGDASRGGEETILNSGTPAETESERGTAWNENPAPAQENLIFPRELSNPERQTAQRLLSRCDGSGQEILDVLAAIIRAGEVRKSPLAVLRGLVIRWKSGIFDPITGLHLAVIRKRQAAIQAQIEMRTPVVTRAGPTPEPRRIPPGALEAMHRALGNSTEFRA
ncbi:MAG: helix-turn-helix domain-containing protein [Methylococcaceae bacterium]|nr:helix-turn-helix domain-containing protein [Methylococcaceae bacterium]